MLIYYYEFIKNARVGEVNYNTGDKLYANNVTDVVQIHDLSTDKVEGNNSYDLVYRDFNRVHSDNENTELFINSITRTYDFYQKYQSLLTNFPLDRFDISPSYSQKFVYADLIDGKIIIQHGLNTEMVVASVYDNDNEMILPTGIKVVDDERIQLTFSFEITGQYTVVIIAKTNGLLEV